jgi:heavy metal sensor kinase
MRSIRLSLMLYFLGLLAVALGAASLLVYRNAEQTLADKQRAMEELIQTQYGERCRDEREKFDHDLVTQAQSLGRVVQVQFERYRADVVQGLYLLSGMLSTSSSPDCHVQSWTWLAEGVPMPRPEPGQPVPPYHEFRRHLPPGFRQIKFDELLWPGDSQFAEYFQIDSPSIKSYYSRSMAGRTFPLNLAEFDPEVPFQVVFDNTVLSPNTPVRRVVVMTSGVGQVFRWGGPRGPRSSPAVPPQTPREPPPSPPRSIRGPTIYIHCAAETDKLDASLALLAQRRDEELAAVASQTDDSLRKLRGWLLGISLAVFAATGVGGFWLVRLGLRPLRRMSDAVSRVSAKDFRLPLDERSLPMELRPIADRLSGTLDLLKRAFAREKQAAADISHELRTPLAALMATAEFALRKPRGPEQYRELLGDCLTSAQQMNQIVERLLTLARLDAGVDRLRVQPVDVDALAQQCANVVRPLAEARGLKLSVENGHAGGDGASLIEIDPDKLREVVTNLLHNAIQYNREGGSVDLRLARDNGTLEVEVRDTGIGIAPEARPHIFERFYRADPSRGSDEPHAGLGLAIVKEYIDLMGGSIGVESTEGQGSTFRVRVPLS